MDAPVLRAYSLSSHTWCTSHGSIWTTLFILRRFRHKQPRRRDKRRRIVTKCPSRIDPVSPTAITYKIPASQSNNPSPTSPTTFDQKTRFSHLTKRNEKDWSNAGSRIEQCKFPIAPQTSRQTINNAVQERLGGRSPRVSRTKACVFEHNSGDAKLWNATWWAAAAGSRHVERCVHGIQNLVFQLSKGSLRFFLFNAIAESLLLPALFLYKSLACFRALSNWGS